MNKIFIFLILFSSVKMLNAQVGIGNTDPKAILDITATNSATPANTDGILIPRIDDFPIPDPGVDQDGLLVFATGVGTPAEGFYYWDNGTTSWVSIGGAGVDTQNTLNEAYNEGGSGAGRIITADNGAVEIQGTGGLRVENNIMVAESVIHDGDTNTFLNFTPDRILVDAGGVNYIDVNNVNSIITVNQGSAAIDFRIESDTEQHMFFVDGSTDAIGIGENAPRSPIHIGIPSAFDLSYSNTGQDGVFIDGGGDNSGINAFGGSIAFGPAATTRKGQRKAAIAAIQTGGDQDNLGLGFFVHGNPINMSDMVEGMRLTGQRYLGINNTSPSANLDVIGSMQFVDGNESNGYVLSSDASGNANWVDPTTLFTETDDQKVDTFGLSGDVLELSLENDGDPIQTADLSNLSFNISNFAVAKMTLTTSQSLPTNAYTKINFDTAAFDLNSNFNTSTDRFEVTEAGYYRINANITQTANNTTTGLFIVAIYINGSALKYSRYSHHGVGSILRSIQAIAYLNAGDFIEIYGFGSSSFNITAATQYTSFEVERIR